MAKQPSILFAHAQFPGQFGGFSRWLAKQGWEVWATGPAVANSGIRSLDLTPHRPPAPQTHPYAQPYDRSVLIGQAAVRACLTARNEGLAPDLIVSHAGPGPGLFLRDVFPRATQVAYCEWWYNSPGVDTFCLSKLAGNVPAAPGPEDAILERTRNQPIAAELLAAGHGLCPTRFQQVQFPPTLRRMLHVQHDGIECETFRPAPAGRPRHPLLAALDPERPLVSYATRGMEPHRAFPQAMAAFSLVQRDNPRAVCVIAGDNQVHYGSDVIRRVDWKARALVENDLDPARTLFTGPLGQQDYLWLLRRSNAHFYGTVPFVLSWSMLEAMATGTPLVLSDTAPVREFADPDCAHLVELDQPARIAEALTDLLADPAAARIRARRARRRIQANCNAAQLHPAKAQWLAGLTGRPDLFQPPLRKEKPMTRKVTKAIFPVAGLGTRFLPATKSVPKEIMTLVDRPLIQYAIDEARAAGITEFIFVTSRGKSALEDYFDHSPVLEQELTAKGKTALLDVLKTTDMDSGAIAYIRQHKALGLGQAVWCARRLIGDEPFAVILPDDVIAADKPCLQQMVEAYEQTGGNMVAAMEVPPEKTSSYGILDVGRDNDNVMTVNNMVEKPAAGEAPSTLAVIGRYILTPRILYNLDCNIREARTGVGGEIQLTDAISQEVGGQGVYGYRFDGQRYDCGSKAGFLQATVAFGLSRPELWDEFSAYLDRMTSVPMAAE